VSRFRFPHAVYFGKPGYEWNDWYSERYEWMMYAIDDPHRNVWLDMERITMHDRYTMPTAWVRGSFRFRRAEDALLYKMRWS
jgi:hypothetical protein